jgi:hypothetical protein
MGLPTNRQLVRKRRVVFFPNFGAYEAKGEYQSTADTMLYPTQE